ncbi:MAG: DUF3098 domain-containing protein [Flavobacteriia bacterium]|nr:DUF3098 domain-containing protein [Flavobacteriia bacterium]
MKTATFLFGKMNYILMFVGLAIIALGYLLMIGGGSEDPEVFNPEIFSKTRIAISPALLVIGFVIEIFAIMWTPSKKEDESAEI